MVDSTNPRVMADNIKKLGAGALTTAAEVEALQIYDNEEADTGKKWIEGSPIYRKVFYIEHLPNATIESYDHNISNLGKVITFYGVLQASGGFDGRTLPYSNITMTFNSAKINIGAGTQDLRAYSAYVIMEYTKATTP